MPFVRVPTYLNAGTYFLTFTVRNWEYVFDKYDRWYILSQTLLHQQRSQSVKLISFVFMINHIHLICYPDDVAGFIGNFKKFVSRSMHGHFKRTEPYVIKRFTNAKGQFQFWEKTNMPKFVENEHFFLQKQNYIHQNPVKKGYVLFPHH